jgi:hypothetical protein
MAQAYYGQRPVAGPQRTPNLGGGSSGAGYPGPSGGGGGPRNGITQALMDVQRQGGGPAPPPFGGNPGMPQQAALGTPAIPGGPMGPIGGTYAQGMGLPGLGGGAPGGLPGAQPAGTPPGMLPGAQGPGAPGTLPQGMAPNIGMTPPGQLPNYG